MLFVSYFARQSVAWSTLVRGETSADLVGLAYDSGAQYYPELTTAQVREEANLALQEIDHEARGEVARILEIDADSDHFARCNQSV